MRRPVSVKNVFLLLSYKSVFLSLFLSFLPVDSFALELSRLCRHPSIRTLCERYSLGAWWVFSFQ
jgi:hypothetical protein